MEAGYPVRVVPLDLQRAAENLRGIASMTLMATAFIAFMHMLLHRHVITVRPALATHSTAVL